MKPRTILLICIAILVYFSLSFYHSGRVKEVMEKGAKKGIQDDWVQLTIEGPGDTKDEGTEFPQLAADDHVRSEKLLSLNQTWDSASGQKPQDEDPRMNALRQQLQTAGEGSERLRQRIEEEERQNKHLSRQAKDLQTRLTQQQNALRDANTRLQEKNQALEKANAEVAGLAEKQSTLEQHLELENAAGISDSLKSTLQAKTIAISKANKRIAGLSKRVEEAENKLAEAEKTIARLQSGLAASQSESTEENLSEQKIKEELLRAQEKNKKLLAEIGDLHARFDDMKARLSTLENDTKKADLRAEAMLRYGQEQAKMLAPSLDEIKTLKARLANQQDLLTQTQQELDLHRQGKLRLQEQLTAQQAKLVQLTALSEQLRQESVDANEAEARIVDLTGKLRQKDELLAGNKTVMNELTASLEETQAKTEAAEERGAMLAKELKTVREQLEGVQNEKEQLQNRLEQTAAERDQLQIALNRSKDSGVESADELTSVSSRLRSLAAENDTLRKQLQEKDGRMEKMTAQLRQAEQASLQLKYLQQEIQQEKNILEQVRTKADRLEIKLAEAEKSKAGSSLVVEELREELGPLRDLAEQRNKELEKLHADLARETRENQDKSVALVVERQNNQKLKDRLAELEQIAKALQLAEQEARQNLVQAGSLKTELDLRDKEFLTIQEKFSALQAGHEALQQKYDALMLKTNDSDGDTVSDADDACPETPAVASVDARGCEIDSDGDGLVDRLDLCPDSEGAEVVNGFGCRPGKPIILDGIVFESGTANLSQTAETSLDKVAGILRRHPGIRFEIGGHTDSIGEPERNLTVSRRRAESVKKYLQSRGIDEKRLEAKGYGAGSPIATNDSPQGRAANRRVEFRILE